MRSASCSAQLTHVCERSLVLCGSMRWFRHPRLLFLFFLLFVVFSAFCVSSLNGLRLDKPAGLPRGSYVGQQGHDQLHRDQKFTLILQTFNRSDLLMKLLNHYSGVHLLSRIIVVWNNMGELPPVDMWRKYEPHPVPVHFIQQEKNRMQNRLQPFSEIDTEAVLILDDDILVSSSDVAFAFSIWQQFSDQIVGFVPRKHVLSTSGVYTYGSMELEPNPGDVWYTGHQYYSMVLIGAAFIHSKYLRMFVEVVPKVIHDLIDETQNCDDLAFNVMVGKALGNRKPAGVYVRPRDMRNLEADAESGYKGMWHQADHMMERSFCLNRLAAEYGQLHLSYSKLEITQFGSAGCSK